jgi:hypothetical protein
MADGPTADALDGAPSASVSVPVVVLTESKMDAGAIIDGANGFLRCGSGSLD